MFRFNCENERSVYSLTSRDPSCQKGAKPYILCTFFVDIKLKIDHAYSVCSFSIVKVSKSENQFF